MTTDATEISLPGDYFIRIDPDLFSQLGYEIELAEGILTVTRGALDEARAWQATAQAVAERIGPKIPLDGRPRAHRVQGHEGEHR